MVIETLEMAVDRGDLVALSLVRRTWLPLPQIYTYIDISYRRYQGHVILTKVNPHSLRNAEHNPFIYVNRIHVQVAIKKET